MTIKSLDSLKHKISKCSLCELAKTRSNVVFGEGNPNARLVLIGEAPGAKEDLSGRPFVGMAGTLLDECLAESGLSREDLYITSVVKCRPNIATNKRSRNRPPSREEICACSDWLERQLEILKPLVIVCLGAVAAKLIINANFRITLDRGKWYPTKYAKKALATLHPAYVLRQMRQRKLEARNNLVKDLAKAKKLLKKRLAQTSGQQN